MFAPPAPTLPRQGRFLYSLCFSGSSSCCTYSSLRLLNAPTEGARGDKAGKAKSASRSYIKGNLPVRPTKQECKPRGCTTAWVRCCLHFFFLTFKISSFVAKQSFFFSHFFATQHGIWALSSLTRDQTCIPCTGSKVLTTRSPRKSPNNLCLA